VTVVSDGVRLLTDVAAAGDEPFMLARALPGVPVLVGADRFASGSLAERELDVTVHVLDDGFQHVQLARDVDLLMVDDRDLDDCVLPAGRLREPLANAAQADAALVTTENPVHARSVAETLGIGAAFTVRRQVHAARALSGADLAGRKDAPVVAFAGIARPERFFADLTSAGWHVAETMPFADHHPFTQTDVDQLAEAARAAGTSMLVTTEKDAVRLQGIDTRGLTIAYIPLTATIEPAERFAPG
jgi:tetraacyldisaccharide 4'-kinase